MTTVQKTDGVKLLRPVLLAAKMLWSLAGAILLFFIGIELLASFLFFMKHHLFRQPVDIRVNADAFGSDHGWVNACWKESLAIPYRWQPHVYWRMQPFQGRFFNINEDGIRKTWNPQTKGSKAIRIFMFGGSTLWGFAIPDDQTIASHLSRILSEQTSQNIQVVNFGQPAYESTQDLMTFVFELQQGETPDLAVFYDGLNDVGSAILNKTTGVTLFEKARAEEFKILQHPGIISLVRSLASAGLQHSNAIRLLVRFHILRPPREKTAIFNKEKVADDLVSVYTSNIKLAQQLAKQNHFPILFYWPPYLRTKQHRTPYENSSMKPSEEDLYTLVYSRIGRSKELQKNSDFYNIGDLLDHNREPLYIDITHLAGHGNELVAKRMAADILPVLKLKQ